MFFTFAVVGGGEKGGGGVKVFLQGALSHVGKLTVDGNRLILRFAEVRQDVFWGHVGDGGK